MDGRTSRVGVAVLLLAAVAAAQEEPRSPLPERVDRTVTVLRDEDHAPIEGATVEVQHGDDEPEVRTTGKDGTAVFRDSPTTDVLVVARAEGRTADSLDLTRRAEWLGVHRRPVDAEAFRSVELDLPKGRVLEGRVLSALDGKPVAGATVEAWSDSDIQCCKPRSFLLWKEETDAAGAFRTDRGSGDSHHVLTAGRDWVSYEFRFAGLHGEVPPSKLDLTMYPAGTIRGTVLDSAKMGIPDAMVVADPPPDLKAPGPGSLWAKTDAEGRFTLPGALVGIPYVLHATGDGTRSALSGEVRVARQGGEAACDLRPIVLGSLFVRVARDSGLKLFLTIDLQVPEADRPFLETSDLDPGKRFHGVFPGRYTVRVDARGWRPLVREVEIKGGERTELDVDLLPGAALEGTVVDEKGEAVADLRMHAGIPDAADPTKGLDEEEAYTDEEGNFRFEGLAEGPVVIRLDRGVVKCTLAEVVKARAPGKGLRIVVRRK